MMSCSFLLSVDLQSCRTLYFTPHKMLDGGTENRIPINAYLQDQGRSVMQLALSSSLSRCAPSSYRIVD